MHQKVMQSHHYKGDFFIFYFLQKVDRGFFIIEILYVIRTINRTINRSIMLIKKHLCIEFKSFIIIFFRTVFRTFIGFTKNINSSIDFKFFIDMNFYLFYYLHFTFQEILVIPHIFFLLI